MGDNNGKSFIAMLYNVLFAPDLCNQLFSIITLMNSGNNCLYHKWFITVLFSDNEHNIVTLPHSTQLKHESLVKTKEKSKSQKQPPPPPKIFGIIASYIRIQVHKVTTICIYCNFFEIY